MDYGICQKALTRFVNQYPQKALDMIHEMSQNSKMLNRGLFREAPEVNKTFSASNIPEGFKTFKDLLTALVEHYEANPTDTSISEKQIMERFQQAIDSKIFDSSRVLYEQAADFIDTYVAEMIAFKESYETNRERLESIIDLTPEVYGAFNASATNFVEKAESIMDGIMTDLLHASGYKLKPSEFRAKKNRISEDFLL